MVSDCSQRCVVIGQEATEVATGEILIRYKTERGGKSAAVSIEINFDKCLDQKLNCDYLQVWYDFFCE